MERSTKIALGVGGGVAALGLGAWAWSRRERDEERPSLAMSPVTRVQLATPALLGVFGSTLRDTLHAGEPIATRVASRLEVIGLGWQMAHLLAARHEALVTQLIGQTWSAYGGVIPTTLLRAAVANQDGKLPGNIPWAQAATWQVPSGEFSPGGCCSEGYDLMWAYHGPVWSATERAYFGRWLNPSPTLTWRDARDDLARVLFPYGGLPWLLRTGVTGHVFRYTNTDGGTLASDGLGGATASDVGRNTLLAAYQFLGDNPTPPVTTAPLYAWPDLAVTLSRVVDFFLRDWIVRRVATYVPSVDRTSSSQTGRWATARQLTQVAYQLEAARQSGFPYQDQPGQGGILGAMGEVGHLFWDRYTYIPPPPDGFSLWRVVFALLSPIMAPLAAGFVAAVAATAASAAASLSSAIAPLMEMATATLGASIARGGLALEVGGVSLSLDFNGNLSIDVHGQRAVTGSLTGSWSWNPPAVAQMPVSPPPGSSAVADAYVTAGGIII